MKEELRKCKKCLLPETYETLLIDEDDNGCNMCKTSTFKKKVLIGIKES